MDKQNIKLIEEELVVKQAKLSTRLEELNKEDPFTDTDRVNDNASVDDDAAEETGHERIEILEETTEKELEQIGATLSRISDGTFGKCEECGGKISDERLKAVPTSTLCMSCLKKE